MTKVYRSSDRPSLLSLVAAIGTRPQLTRRDGCGDWCLFGRIGHVFAAILERQGQTMLQRAHWLRLVANGVPSGKKVGNVISAKRAQELWDEVARELGFRDAYNLTQSLDADEKGTCTVSTLGGDQELTIISEPGLYRAEAHLFVMEAIQGAIKSLDDALRSLLRVLPTEKRKRIEAALRSDPSRSDRAIARDLGCSPTTVGKVRTALGLTDAVRTVHRGGQTYQFSGDTT